MPFVYWLLSPGTKSYDCPCLTTVCPNDQMASKILNEAWKQESSEHIFCFSSINPACSEEKRFQVKTFIPLALQLRFASLVLSTYIQSPRAAVAHPPSPPHPQIHTRLAWAPKTFSRANPWPPGSLLPCPGCWRQPNNRCVLVHRWRSGFRTSAPNSRSCWSRAATPTRATLCPAPPPSPLALRLCLQSGTFQLLPRESICLPTATCLAILTGILLHIKTQCRDHKWCELSKRNNLLRTPRLDMARSSPALPSRAS